MEALHISREEAGQKLLVFLDRRVEGVPAEFMRWLRTGQVRLNGGRAKPFDRVAEGDLVRVPPFARLRAPDKTLFPIQAPPPYPGAVYEDEELLVLAKPAGLPTHGGSGHSDSLAARMADHYAGLPFVPAPAHRLDKSTSGLILAGKSYACQRALQDAMAEDNGPVIKEYLAWVHGVWPQRQVWMEDFVAKRKQGGSERMVVVAGSAPGALPARAQATLLRTLPGGEASLLLLRLFTGRTHQLRLQLSQRGHPVMGDGKYRLPGPPQPLLPLKLHACRIEWQGQLFTLLPNWPAPYAVDTLPPMQPRNIP